MSMHAWVQPHVIFIHFLYLAKINPVLRICYKAQLVDRLHDDVKVAGSSPLCTTTVLPTKFACGIHLYSWNPTVRITKA